MRTEPPRVAVVDDDAEVRVALARLLAAAGYAPETFPSGEAFLQSMHARAPDCVVLDVHMPGMSGFEVQRRLAPDHARIPVVFITGREVPESCSRAAHGGARGCLSKPVDQETLLHAIRDALAH